MGPMGRNNVKCHVERRGSEEFWSEGWRDKELFERSTESLILAQDERWRRA